MTFSGWAWWVAGGVLLSVTLLIVVLLALYALAPARLLELGMWLGRVRAGLRLRGIEVDGQRWSYLDSGGALPVLVLVHGYAASKETWLAVAAHLKRQGLRLVVVDLPGFGASAPTLDGDYRIEAQAARLQAFVAALGIRRFHLMGHSMGGYLAGAYAGLFRAQLLSAYLVAPAGVGGRLSSALQPLSSEASNPLFVDSVERFHSTMALAMARPPRLPLPLVRAIVAREAPLQGLRLQQTAFWTSAPLEQLLQGCQVPVRLSWGRLDRILPVEQAAVLLAACPQISLVELPGVGHMPPLEASAMLAADYLAFVRTLSAAP
jgi:pimeloyl-ACP methyl ester carboxylesterase